MKKFSTIYTALLLTGLSAQSTMTHASDTGNIISNTVIEGAIEIEAGFSNDYNDENSSDIAVATVELSINSTINEKISSHIVLLHEEDETALEVDEASISIDLGNGYLLTAGQLYLPFGNFETNMVSDSLPLELGETRETAVQLDIESGSVTSSVYLFNGDVIENNADDSVASMGLNITYSADSFTTGISYINNITDSDLISESLASTPATTSYVSAMSVYANASFGKTSVFVEYMTALDEFDAADLSISTSNKKPATMNLEAGFDLDGAMLAIAYQTTSEAVDFDLPEGRVLVSYSMDLMKNTSLAFELASDTDYSVADGGTGENASALTTQLVIAF